MSYATVPHIVHPRAVARHLSRATFEQVGACMTSSYLRVPGAFGWGPDQLGLIFMGREGIRSRAAGIEIGQSVRVDYRHGADSLMFFSRITEALEPGTWRLSRPGTVQRLARRKEERHPISPSSGNQVAMMTNQGMQAFPIVDLSSGGAAVQYDARVVGLWVGRRVTVWLEAGGVKGVALTSEVRHISRRGCAPGHKLAGLRFVDLDLDARRAVDQVLTDG